MDKTQRILFLFINCLFVSKYTIRIGFNPSISIILYCLFLMIVWWFIFGRKPWKNQKYKTTYFFILSVVVIVISLSYHFINPNNLQVDRWSAIHNFIQNLFNGEYPYAAHTHLGGYGSPFPVWQVFHIPFYLLGNVGLGMLFSFVFLSLFLIWLFEKNYRKAFIYIVLLLISPAFWYEVAVRSDLIYNFILCFITIAFINKKAYSIQRHALGLGILCGLFLSTRLSIVIPFSVYLFPEFIHLKIKQKIIFVIVIIFVFTISFLPFIFWNYNTLFFSEYNPFVLQTRKGSILEVLIITIIGIYLSTKWKDNISLCYSYTSIALFILVSFNFLHRMISDNFINGLFDSAYDITYFNMALPFIICTLTTSNNRTSTMPIEVNKKTDY